MKQKTLLALLISTALVSTGIFQEASLIVSAEPTTDSEIQQLQELETVDESFEPEHIDSGAPPEEAIILEDITTSLPASYDSRDKQVVTPVKNQGNYGTCWAFAATNAAESSLLSTGLADDANTCDLSESQLAYFTYHQRKDPLNMITTDYLLAKDNDYLNSGGKSFFATFNYACWSGVTKEDEITAYENLTEDTVLPDCYAFEKDAAHLKNAYWLSLDMKDEVKQSIMKYGAVTATYFHDSENLNYDTFAYHDPVFGFNGNHAVSIIGWDDNYSKENFLAGRQPENDGAWLVKNSWGEDWGLDGYFWMSYECERTFSVEVFEFSPATEYDYNYQYDGGLCFDGAELYGDSGCMANTFICNSKEELKAVSFYTAGHQTNYIAQIYFNTPEGDSPTIGDLVYETKGFLPYSGYHTIDFEDSVALKKGQKFSVVITLFGQKDSLAFLYLDFSNDCSGNENGFSGNYIADAHPGESFVKSVDSEEWKDVSAINRNCRIKAFTSKVPLTYADSITLSHTELGLLKGETANLTATLTPADTDDFVTFTSSDETIATVDENGNITTLKPGTATITATTVNNLTSSCKVTVYQDTFSDLKVTPYTGEYDGTAHDALQIENLPEDTQVFYSTDGITYTSSLPQVTEVGTTTVYVKCQKNLYMDYLEQFTVEVVDTTSPTGEIAIGFHRWNGFFDEIYYGLCFQGSNTATITGSDLSGIQSISYYLSETALSQKELASITDWCDYTAPITFQSDGNTIVYGKLTDTHGNISYLSSDGLTFDTTAPVISLPDNSTYDHPVNVTITDIHLDNIWINGVEQSLWETYYTLSPSDTPYVILARDSAGNTSCATIYVSNPEPTATPTITVTAIPTVTPVVSPIITTPKAPTLPPTKSPVKTVTPTPQPAKKGDSFTLSGITYKITKASKTNGTVTVTGITSKKKSLTIPASVKQKGITYKVTGIQKDAFKNKKTITSITLGKSITSIGNNAFYGCSKLKKITIKSTSLKTVGKNAFKGVHKNAIIRVPEKKLKAYQKLLKKKGQKSSVSIIAK